MGRSLCVVCAVVLATGGCGGESQRNPEGSGGSDPCGAGTVYVDGECVPGEGGSGSVDGTPPTITASPAGGAFCAGLSPIEVTLASDEPATIYYTTDGSEPTTASPAALNQAKVVISGGDLKYFAVDEAGNASAVETQTYSADGELPAAITDLEASIDGGKANLSWANPDDADVLILASPFGANDVPETCASYQVGDVVGGSVVVHVGSGSSAKFAAVRGWHGYSVWAVDAVGNYAAQAPRAALLNVAKPPAYEGTISIAKPKSAPEVTVTKQPSHVQLSAQASYEDGVLTIAVGVENSDTGVALMSPKLALADAAGGTPLNHEGEHDGKPYWRPDGSDPGIDPLSTRTFTLRLDGIPDGANPLTLDLALVHSPTLVFAEHMSLRLFDTDTLTVGGRVRCVAPSQLPSQRCVANSLILTPDQRRVIMGSRGKAALVSFDIAYSDQSHTIPLEGFSLDDASVQAVAADWARNRILAAVSHRCFRNLRGGGGGIDLVALDAFTLEERARRTLEPMGNGTAAMDLALSPDGKRIALIASDGSGQSINAARVHFVDAETLQPIDTDANLVGANPVDLLSKGASMRLNSVSWLSNDVVIAAERRDARYWRIDAANGYATSQIGHSVAASTRTAKLVRAPDGAVWAVLPRNGTHGLLRFAGGNGIHFGQYDGIAAVAFHPDGSTAYLVPTNDSPLYVVSASSPGSVIDSANLPPAGRHKHFALVTPY